jgi:hypothetical protein
MSLDRLNKMLASSFVSKMIEKGRDPKTEALANLNFKELETLYYNTLQEIESSPEIRKDLVESLKKYQQEHGDLNDLYSTNDIASDPTLQSIMLMDE